MSDPDQAADGLGNEDGLHGLLVALEIAPPGALVFVELTSPEARRTLPTVLDRLGLHRTTKYFHFAANLAEEQRGGFVAAVLADFLASGPLPEILYVDGFESRDDFRFTHEREDAIESLNLSRETLTRLGPVIVFLMPSDVIRLVRRHALNLWSWRSFHFVLDGTRAPAHRTLTSTHGHGAAVDSSSARIASLSRWVDEALAARRPAGPIVDTLARPLLEALSNVGRYGEATELAARIEPLLPRLTNLQHAAWNRELARTLRALGEFGRARQLLEQAVEWQREDRADELELAATHVELARVLDGLGRDAEAEQLWRRALEVYERRLGPSSVKVGFVLFDLGWLWMYRGDLAAAEGAYSRALQIARANGDPQLEADALRGVARIRHEQARYQDADRLLEQAIELLDPTTDQLAIARNKSDLAHMLGHNGEYERGEQLAREALKTALVFVDSRHSSVQTIERNLKDIMDSAERARGDSARDA